MVKRNAIGLVANASQPALGLAGSHKNALNNFLNFS
jgi:hypothetical protein